MKAANCPRKIDPNLRLKNIAILKKKIKNIKNFKPIIITRRRLSIKFI